MQVIAGMAYANDKHGTHKRRTGCPYIVHPMIVSELVRNYKSSKNLDELIIAALLHDVLEDCVGYEENDSEEEREVKLNIVKKEILNKFGPMVLAIVIELTSDDKLIAQMGKNRFLIEKMILMSSYALVVKLCDRLSNIMDEPKPKYLEDTKLMMLEILERRPKLSKTHRRIIKDIQVIVGE